MRRRAVFVSLLLCAAAVAVAGEPGSYGKPLPQGTSTPVAQAIAAFDAHAGKPARFSGRITQVCQAKGCWMVLEDDGQTARVMFGDHAFALPKDSRGRAEVHGVLSRKELTPAQVQHLQEDANGLPVSPVEYRILADGVRLVGE
jgi:hypothetical protein